MARGHPAAVSTLISLPFLTTSLLTYTDQLQPVPSNLALPLGLFAAFVIAMGLYVQFVVSPPEPNLREDEEIVLKKHPTQRVSYANIVISFPLLALTGYLLYFTMQPYIYPILTFAAGLYLLSTGLHRYWSNCLTNFFVTNQRAMKEFVFISLVRKEIPLNRVRGFQERRSVTETLVGLGNVRIASGGGGSGTLEIVFQNIEEPTTITDKLRNLVK